MALIEKEFVAAKLTTSNAWVARAIYRLACEFDSIPKDGLPTNAKDDKLFFETLRSFFSENGFFTDRHIAIARQKIREPYINYLVTIATT